MDVYQIQHNGTWKTFLTLWTRKNILQWSMDTNLWYEYSISIVLQLWGRQSVGFHCYMTFTVDQLILENVSTRGCFSGHNRCFLFCGQLGGLWRNFILCWCFVLAWPISYLRYSLFWFYDIPCPVLVEWLGVWSLRTFGSSPMDTKNSVTPAFKHFLSVPAVF